MDVYIVGSDSDSDDYLGTISDKPAVYLILGRTGLDRKSTRLNSSHAT